MYMSLSSFLGTTVHASSSIFAGIGKGPILVYQSYCSGGERTLLECHMTKIPYSRCSHYNDVTVQCKGKYVLSLFHGY